MTAQNAGPTSYNYVHVPLLSFTSYIIDRLRILSKPLDPVSVFFQRCSLIYSIQFSECRSPNLLSRMVPPRAMKPLNSRARIAVYMHLITKTILALPRRLVISVGVLVAIGGWLLTHPSTIDMMDFSAYGADMLKYRAVLERKYKHVLVGNCISRLPTGGRTVKTKVKGVNVNYVSWAETEEKSITSLRAYPPVRAMSKFRRPAVLLDVGANIGKISFPTMGMFEPHTVIAVEPVRKNMDALCMGANLNGWNGHPNLILVEAAMSDADGEMQIFVPEGREDNSALSSTAATANVHVSQHPETIYTVSGDGFLEAGGFKPDVIKIDTQGHELHVLRGLRNYLKRAKRVLVIAESDPKLMKQSGVDPMDVYKLMIIELKYTPYYHVDVDVKNGELHVTGEIIPEEIYPTKTARDIYYFKEL